MTLSGYFTQTVIMSCIAAVLGWWLKSRLDNSIKHEYDRLLELFKVEQKRSETLHAERLAAFKVLSNLLLALRRYCHAKNPMGEFASRPDSLTANENISLLSHHDVILRALEERELFISPQTRQCFTHLYN